MVVDHIHHFIWRDGVRVSEGDHLLLMILLAVRIVPATLLLTIFLAVCIVPATLLLMLLAVSQCTSHISADALGC